MRFAIVDDIPAMQQELKEIIYDYCRSTDTIADICCFDSGEAFIAAFVPYSYDIVFMDIYERNERYGYCFLNETL
jgi:DNA-binding LytR/AlgR family response regulator